MTIERPQFSRDKRITNDAMRLVRGIFPNIGPAYSDKRHNGRRYKFEQIGHKKVITPAVVAEINKLFAEANIRAKAYLHEPDGRACPSFWDGHLCIRTYDESNIKSNNTNTTPIMKSKKNTTTTPSTQDVATIIAAALEQHFASKPTTASTNNRDEDEIFTFTGDQLCSFVRMIAVSVSEQCLDNVRDVTIDQDSANLSMELLSTQIRVDVDMDAVADDLVSSFEDVVDYLVEEDDNIQRWYESVKG